MKHESPQAHGIAAIAKGAPGTISFCLEFWLEQPKSSHSERLAILLRSNRVVRASRCRHSGIHANPRNL